MAKIQDTIEQKEALKTIEEGLKTLETIQNMRAGNITYILTASNDDGKTIGKLNPLPEQSEQHIEKMLKQLRESLQKQLPKIARKHHISFDKKEEALLYRQPLGH